VLKGQPAIYGRAAAYLPADLAARRLELEATVRRPVSERELSSWLLFGALRQYARHRDRFGDVSALPTPAFSTDFAKAKTSTSRWRPEAPA
jgi:pyruvate carboxylase